MENNNITQQITPPVLQNKDNQSDFVLIARWFVVALLISNFIVGLLAIWHLISSPWIMGLVFLFWSIVCLWGVLYNYIWGYVLNIFTIIISGICTLLLFIIIGMNETAVRGWLSYFADYLPIHFFCITCSTCFKYSID